jgi:hypothetical protein
MRQLVIVVGFSLASASAQAQTSHPSTYGTFAPNKSPPKSISGGTVAPFPGPEPYRAHAPPAAPKSPGNTDGGEAFKPFKGSSIYSDRGGLDPYPKPAKPKHSTYDH